MHETQHDRAMLEHVLTRSQQQAGEFLRSSFEIPEKSLSATQLINRLQGMVTLVMATVTSDGRPRAAPVVAAFYRGAFCIPTVRTALRARHVQRNPQVSLSLYEGNDFAVIVHGVATFVEPGNDDFDRLVQLQIETGNGDVREWGDPLFIRVEADRLYTFARYPDQFPEI